METKPLHTEREFLMSKDTEKISLLNFMECLKNNLLRTSPLECRPYPTGKGPRLENRMCTNVGMV